MNVLRLNIFGGFKDTLEILAFRWTMVKSRLIRNTIIIVALIATLAVYSTAHLSSLIRLVSNGVAASTNAELANTVITYIKTFTAADSAYAISAVLAALLGALLFVPLLGYSFSGLVPAGDLVSVRRNDYHLLSDSIVLQFLSSISLVQILFITLLNSILVIDSPHPGLGIIAGWGLWLIVVLSTVVAAWTFEYLHRRFGSYSKYLALAVLAGIAGIFYLLFRKQATGLFGLSALYGGFIRGLDTYPWWLLLISLACYAVLLYTVLALISFIGGKALALQERPRRRGATQQAVFGRKRQQISLPRFLAAIVAHQRNIRRPLVFIGISVFISACLFGSGGQFLYFFAAITPIFVALSWGVNTFGIIGGGTTWLVSLPGGKRKMLWSIAAVQFLLIAIIQVIILLPETLVYHVEVPVLTQFMLATAATSMYITRSALSKAVYQPERYRVHIRGEAVLPPAKALAYLGRFFAGCAFIDILMFGFATQLWEQLAVLGIVGIWQFLRFLSLNKSWQREPEIVENIIKSVGY